MGASNKIQDTNLEITKFTCSNCSQPFTQQDKSEGNFELWWDTSGEVKIDTIWQNNNGFTMSIWVRDITHKLITTTRLINDNPRTEEEWNYYNCPDTEPCQSCDKRFPVEKMINPRGNFDYYCSPCYQKTKEF
ncbi:MAG: hypothetical protein MRERV_78c005 [Mycoplasmataceae bacterium RV_VA103A]|nr:MAG: hypothetical protein MRERV_78c005 [Mycoplasmataceae bacterium RV_VA103A]